MTVGATARRTRATLPPQLLRSWEPGVPSNFCNWLSFFAGHCGKLTVLPQTSLLNLKGEGKKTYMSKRVVFKIAGLVHQSLVGLAPEHLADDCRLLSDVGRRPLRSNSNYMRKLLVPRTHNKLDDRSFSAAGPRPWNDLPPELRRPGLTFDSFRQSLKTHLFGDRRA